MVRSWASQVPQMVKNTPAKAGSIPGSGRSPGGGYGDPFQYSCLGNPMDRTAWRADRPWGCKESNTTEQLSLFFPPHTLGFELMLLFFKIILFIIHFWLCWLFYGVCRLSLVAGGKGYSLGVVLRLFTVVGSLCCGAQGLGTRAQ